MGYQARHYGQSRWQCARTRKFKHILDDLQYITRDNDGSKVLIENFVGYTSVPLGLAGPLRIHDFNGASEDAYAPMATTEAALIASCCRGCKAFNMSGGVHYSVLGEAMSRGPVFQFDSPREAILFTRRLPDIKDSLATAAESTSRHVHLQDLASHIIESNVHVILKYTCGDAAGQNMVTFATQHACDWLQNSSLAAELNIKGFLIEGNMTSDKKPSWGSVKESRGVESVLGCTTEDFYKTYRAAQEGGIRNGQFGSNVNAANVITAIFIATGQDVASVAEGAWSLLTLDYDNASKTLKISIYLPSLPVGTVGGGTGYNTQKEALQIMKCAGPGMKPRFAGLIATFAMALEISTIASGANDTFSRSHQRLARQNKM
ncbi:hydroxymethylglutaryl-CoA reductase [Aspergillus avenaceus]|uniref:hydroxymethylglutaryl-CoA reductase (NADPH) n=1 Tax=Aspergillus avenaceus TaxID=36643 RepID=A0A5N6TDU7_ASPAV|nr:hydroxymethylglutaryl-CoA reductase [Aspergillus avenaceus]